MQRAAQKQSVEHEMLQTCAQKVLKPKHTQNWKKDLKVKNEVAKVQLTRQEYTNSKLTFTRFRSVAKKGAASFLIYHKHAQR